MKTFPLPVILASASAVASLPFDGTTSAMLALTAGLGAILSVDYARRYRGLPLPRRARVAPVRFKAPPLCCENNRLAA